MTKNDTILNVQEHTPDREIEPPTQDQSPDVTWCCEPQAPVQPPICTPQLTSAIPARSRKSFNFSPGLPIASNPTSVSAEPRPTPISRKLFPEDRSRRVASMDSTSLGSADLDQYQCRARPAALSPSPRSQRPISIDVADTDKNMFELLARKERRVVDLRDELSRVREELREAEKDLRLFRDWTSSSLTREAPLSSSSSHAAPTTAEIGLDVLLKPNPSVAPLVRGQSPTLPPPASSTETSKRPSSVYTGSTVNQDTQTPETAVFNMGRRVVEELGSQLWGIVEDLRSVTIGEEPRHPSSRDNPSKPASVAYLV